MRFLFINNVLQKLTLLWVLFFVCNINYGQSYLLKDRVYTTDMDTSSLDFSRGIEVINTGSINLNFDWTLTLKDTLIDCRFELCNSGECFALLQQGGTMPTIPPGGKGWLKMHMFTGRTFGTNKIKYVLKGATTIDTLTYIINVVRPTGLSELSRSSEKLTFFPNPAKDIITITNSDATEISVYDVTGKFMFTKKIAATEHRLDLSGLNSGQYYIIARTSTGIRKGKLLLTK